MVPTRGNPGDEGIPWDDGESLLGEGLPARALCESFATVRKAHLVHATIIPGQAQPPLPFTVNCSAVFTLFRYCLMVSVWLDPVALIM